jgi:hypothetical protein
LKIVASSDLGPLGSSDGSPVNYNWVLPGIAPLLLPWLFILGLLALKPNRTAAAWLIWLPIGCLMAFSSNSSAFLPSGADFFLDIIAALTVGLAAIWLLSSHLRRQHGFLTFLCVLLALAGFSVLAAVFRQSGSEITIELLPVGIILLLGTLVTSITLSLAGLICHRRYRPFGLYLWLFLLLAAIWLLIAAPFVVVAMISSSGRVEWYQFFVPVLVMATVNFALLLPFLILSSASSFFRERLKIVLHVKPEIPPPLAAPPPDTTLKT